MRGTNTNVTRLRRRIFVEVAKIAFQAEDETLKDEIEAIPYAISPSEEPKYRESIFRERAIAGERVRLAMGMSIRPQDKPVHLTAGLRESNISQQYYEPPLMQVIPSACAKCEDHVYEVSDQCRACVGRACVHACPTDAVLIGKNNGNAYIDREKCIRCGKCKTACPYDAIAHKVRPCAAACGVNAVVGDDLGRAKIDSEKCVACGQCMVHCPFGAIADKSQIFQLGRAIRKQVEVAAVVAPAIVGQFGGASMEQIKEALKRIGFRAVFEVAVGADVGAATEAHHYATKVATGELPFLLTSCCPAWSMLAKKQFPDMIDKVSNSLTPMVATARFVKQMMPKSKVVFIGPCAAKKLEAMRKSVRSDVDFVITFEELSAIFEALQIDAEACRAEETKSEEATGSGRGYGVAGGVASAIERCVREYYPDVSVKTEHAEGLVECRKMLLLAKAGKKDGCLIEGMGCFGGCVGGAGINIPIEKGREAVKKYADNSAQKIPPKELYELRLP